MVLTLSLWLREEVSTDIYVIFAIALALEQLWQQKEEIVREFSDVQSQIQKISREIVCGFSDENGDNSSLLFAGLKGGRSRITAEVRQQKFWEDRNVKKCGEPHQMIEQLGLSFWNDYTKDGSLKISNHYAIMELQNRDMYSGFHTTRTLTL
ncbi:hypothetical protein Bca101_056871 [Brassica carinata]